MRVHAERNCQAVAALAADRNTYFTYETGFRLSGTVCSTVARAASRTRAEVVYPCVVNTSLELGFGLSERTDGSQNIHYFYTLTQSTASCLA